MIGSGCCPAAFANTVLQNSVLTAKVSKDASLYAKCYDEEGRFDPKRMINARIRIRNPKKWKDNKGFSSAFSFFQFLSSGPIYLSATRDIQIGEEIICLYPFHLKEGQVGMDASVAQAGNDVDEIEVLSEPDIATATPSNNQGGGGTVSKQLQRMSPAHHNQPDHLQSSSSSADEHVSETESETDLPPAAKNSLNKRKAPRINDLEDLEAVERSLDKCAHRIKCSLPGSNTF